MPLKKGKGPLRRAKARIADWTGRLPVPGIRMAKRLSAKTADKAIKQGSYKNIRHSSGGTFVKEKTRKTVTGGKKKVVKTWGSDRLRQSREVEIQSAFRGRKLSKELMKGARDAAKQGQSYKGVFFDVDAGYFIRETRGLTSFSGLGLKEGPKMVTEIWDKKGNKLSKARTVFRPDKYKDFEKTKIRTYKS
jgi:hypothetical protein